MRKRKGADWLRGNCHYGDCAQNLPNPPRCISLNRRCHSTMPMVSHPCSARTYEPGMVEVAAGEILHIALLEGNSHCNLHVRRGSGPTSDGLRQLATLLP